MGIIPFENTDQISRKSGVPERWSRSIRGDTPDMAQTVWLPGPSLLSVWPQLHQHCLWVGQQCRLSAPTPAPSPADLLNQNLHFNKMPRWFKLKLQCHGCYLGLCHDTSTLKRIGFNIFLPIYLWGNWGTRKDSSKVTSRISLTVSSRVPAPPRGL